MKVLFLQDHLETGGAARAAARYAIGLERLGHQVVLAAGDQQKGAEDFVVTGKPPRGWKRAWEALLPPQLRRYQRRQRALHCFRKALATIQPDIVWVHNIHGAFKWGWGEDLVQEACRTASVVWTLHDMWALGKGEFYFSEQKLEQEFPSSPLGRLQKNNNRHSLVLTAPSEWLRQLSGRQNGGYAHLRLPYYLDTAVFQPAYREGTRRHFGIKSGEILLLSVAENLKDPRKGIDWLCQFWREWQPKKETRLGLVGRNGSVFHSPNHGIFDYGLQGNEADVASLMAAADLFVLPSSADNFPLVLEESQACGTPVIAFDVGGIGEAFQHEQTGFLLKTRTMPELWQALERVLEQPKPLRSMRALARDAMVTKHKEANFARDWDRVIETVRNSTDGN